MAKTTKTKRAARAGARSSRKTAKRGSRARHSGGKSGFMSGMLDFSPPGWMKDILQSQTSRVILAEALVAAAGAAAAVIAASRTETGRKAGAALADSGAVMKEAALSAAAAAREVIGRSATQAIGSAASKLLGEEPVAQQELSEKAMRMRRDHADDMSRRDLAENVRRHRGPERPH